MRHFLSFLLTAVLALSLCSCGSPSRNADNYYVDETDNGWCILYKDEEGSVEEIAVMGDYRQPMVLDQGRFYFTQPGALLSVNADGKDLQKLSIPDMPAGSYIAYMDEDGFYCVAEDAATTCWQVDKAMKTAEKVTIPHKFRTIDYPALLAQIVKDSSAVDNDIRVTNARAELDSNGSLSQLGLELLVYIGEVSYTPTWNHVGVSVTVTVQGPQVTYTDHNLPLSLGEDTVQQNISLQDFFAALQKADTAEVAAKHADGTADAFFLVYADEDFAYNAANAPTLTVTGEATERNDDAFHLILAQVGGTKEVMTDRRGTPCGNLLVLQAT